MAKSESNHITSCIISWENTVDESDSNCWQFKICTQRSCLRAVCGTIEPPPHGVEI